MRKALYLGLLALLPVFSPVYALDPEAISDVRCIVVGLRFSRAADSTQRSAGLMLSLYYIGRLDGHVPGYDLEDAIVQQMKTMTLADFASEARRCGGSLQDKGKQITEIGQHLIQRGQQMQPGSAAPNK